MIKIGNKISERQLKKNIFGLVSTLIILEHIKYGVV